MRSRASSVLGSLVFLVIAPGMVAGYVPYVISRWRLRPPLLGLAAGRVVGGLLVLAGVASILHSFARFALEGRGTPAPVAPTETLVVSGQYRYVRNPMYVAVVAIIVGQALLFGSRPLVWYALALIGLLFHAFVLAYEEPTLGRRYGESYERYRIERQPLAAAPLRAEALLGAQGRRRIDSAIARRAGSQAAARDASASATRDAGEQRRVGRDRAAQGRREQPPHPERQHDADAQAHRRQPQRPGRA